MTIETPRLCLQLLSPAQLTAWLEDLPALEQALGCRYLAEPMEGVFREIVAAQCRIAAADPARLCWHSFFWLIRRSDRTVVGAADFKAPPSPAGEVELGYGLGEGFRHMGYMTEAARALCGWAFTQPGVKAVTAETEAAGLASQRVLARCGFRLVSAGESYWWRLEKPAAGKNQEERCENGV